MRIGIISFTRTGKKLAEVVKERLAARGDEVFCTVKCAGVEESYEGSLKDWIKEAFAQYEALVFVGAVGIAVRGIAPFIVSKKEDPAVVVVDEKGRFSIPILSGHLGGANELAEFLAKEIGAVPVVTTATDLHHKWQVDVFAGKNQLQILDMQMAKKVSAKVLQGGTIPVEVETQGSIGGSLPEEVKLTKFEEFGVYIGVQKNEEREKLVLVPKAVILGIGCRKETSVEQIEHAVEDALDRANIYPEAVGLVASIDLKKQEEGILEFCKGKNLPFVTFSKEELEAVKGEFQESAFVKQVTGVDNVCERSAICAGGVKLLLEKQAKQGVTVALAVKEWSVYFE